MVPGKSQICLDRALRVANLSRLSEHKSSAIPMCNLSVSFYQNTISRSQGNFSKVREHGSHKKVPPGHCVFILGVSKGFKGNQL